MVKVKKTTDLSIQSLGAEWRQLAEIVASGEPDQKLLAIEQVIEFVEAFHLSARRIEQLKTAVTRAVTNNGEPIDQDFAQQAISIRIMAALQTIDARAYSEAHEPGGWGFFLIEKMSGEAWLWGEMSAHIIELFLYLEGEI